jgi:hypothetical protein
MSSNDGATLSPRAAGPESGVAQALYGLDARCETLLARLLRTQVA